LQVQQKNADWMTRRRKRVSVGPFPCGPHRRRAGCANRAAGSAAQLGWPASTRPAAMKLSRSDTAIRTCRPQAS